MTLTSRVRAATTLVFLMCAVPEISAYSVLSHEAAVDAVWDGALRPLLVRRFPHTSANDLLIARSYAYGGSVIQDLGYYPFGSRFFSNLLHYVRSGDFVETLIGEAHDVNEYAFALGALAHYAADNTGHPEAINRAVPLMFPKLREKYGDHVTYAQSRTRHVVVEFSFDVVQAAIGAFLPQRYHDFIGFQVPAPVLERAFRRTYGLEMKDVFGDEELAISTYRHAVSEIFPEISRVAWKDKRDQILAVLPDAKPDRMVFAMTRGEYEAEFGARYRKPGLFARFLAFIYRIVPKIGPLAPLKFETPTVEAEELFRQSFNDTRQKYRGALRAIGEGRLNLANTDFDTGRPAKHGEYPLADETHAELLKRLEDVKPGAVPDALRRDLLAYYDGTLSSTPQSRKERKENEKIRRRLAQLAAPTPGALRSDATRD